MARVKLGKFYEQPKVYIPLVAFAIFLATSDFYQKAGILLGFVTLLSAILYFIRKPKLLVNTHKNNTPGALGIALVGVGAVIGAALVTGYIFGFDLGNMASFIEANRGALFGAQASPLSNNPLVNLFVFVIAFAIAETILLSQLFDFILFSFGGKLSLSDIRVWIVAAIMAFGAIFYHIQAKALATGGVNENTLMVIFWIFFVECIMMVYTGEVESAIWHHILNNAIAYGFAAIGAALLGNPIFIVIIVIFIILSRTKFARDLFRKIT